MSAASSKAPTVAVIGAAGLSGLFVVKALVQAGIPVRAVVHSDAGAARAREAGAVEIVHADLAAPATIRAGLDGTEAVYMAPPPLDPREGDFAATALHAAEAAGAARFVYLSVLHPHSPALNHHMRKAAAEIEIRRSALAWTILQPAIFAQNICLMFGQHPAGRVPVPYDPGSCFSVIDLRELAEIAVKTLTESGHERASYELCGPPRTIGQMVRAIGEARGIVHEPFRVPPAEAPIPPRFAGNASATTDLRAMFEDYDHHGLRGNPRVFTMLLGREPAPFERVARDVFSS